jgi:hypothetical protein
MIGSNAMIHQDAQLQGAQERIAFFSRLVANMRQVEKLENFTHMASGYLAEIEKMHAETPDIVTSQAL